MRNRKIVDELLSNLDEDNPKDLILYFLIESQLLEYGIIYLLTKLPFLPGSEIEDIIDKPLGILVNELERTKDSDMVELAKQAREFNRLRKEIIHNLIFLEVPINNLGNDIKKKIRLAQQIRAQIDAQFNYVYEMTIGIPYGSIF